MDCNSPLRAAFWKCSELGKNLNQILVCSRNQGHKKSLMTWVSYGRGAEEAEFVEDTEDGKAFVRSFGREGHLRS